MAKTSLSKNHLKQNLTPAQTILLHDVVLVGNKMADHLDHEPTTNKEGYKLASGWSAVMVRLTKVLIWPEVEL